MRTASEEKLSKEQVEIFSLLSIASFLEYFDLMFYVHMTVLWNDVFFPTATKPLLASFVTAFSWSSVYLLRHIGALCFGHVRDIFGRRTTTVIITTTIAICCLTVATLPTYSQIGIAAPIILLAAQMIQCMSASADIKGTEIYIAESIRPPKQYSLVGFAAFFSTLGSSAALGVACIVTNPSYIATGLFSNSWRIAFFCGTAIGIIGAVVRNTLQEASEFTDKQKLFKAKTNTKSTNMPSALALVSSFFIYCGRPACFYFAFGHCSTILKNNFGLSTSEIISNSLIVSVVDVVATGLIAYLSYKIAPLKIIKFRSLAFFSTIIFFPFAMEIFPSAKTVLIFQYITVVFNLSCLPAVPLFFKYLPVLTRFRYASIIKSLSTVCTYILTSFGLVLITEICGHKGIFIIFAPIGLFFGLSLIYFERRESEALSCIN
jgi:MHS family proline/betaine transporter-like MFS transporter